jgi:cytochrome c peroxidase
MIMMNVSTSFACEWKVISVNTCKCATSKALEQYGSIMYMDSDISSDSKLSCLNKTLSDTGGMKEFDVLTGEIGKDCTVVIKMCVEREIE